MQPPMPTPYGKAFSSLGRLLDPITQDACAFFNDHVLIEAEGGKVVFALESGRTFASQFGSGKAAIHQNHGLFTVGETVDAAAFWFFGNGALLPGPAAGRGGRQPKVDPTGMGHLHPQKYGQLPGRLVKFSILLGGDQPVRS